jgi:hypothetical protein
MTIRIPEWLKMLVVSFGLMLLAIVVFRASLPQYYPTEKPKPVIYVTSRPEYLNVDGNIVYSLEYSIDGAAQVPINFATDKERIEYEGWLYQVGRRAK